jgi:hypothetical protein
MDITQEAIELLMRVHDEEGTVDLVEDIKDFLDKIGWLDE